MEVREIATMKIADHCCHLATPVSVCVCFGIFKLDLSMLNSICMWLCFFLSLSLSPSSSPLFNLIESLMWLRAPKIIRYICWGRSVQSRILFDCLKPRISLFSTYKRKHWHSLICHFLFVCVWVSIDMIVFHCVYIGRTFQNRFKLAPFQVFM